MKSWLQDNNIKLYSTYHDLSVITEGFIRTWKSKTFNYMSSMSKNVNIDKLDDVVDKYNNTYHKTIQMKPIDVKSSLYIDIEVHILTLKFKIMIKILKLLSAWEYQDIKMFLQKATIQIGQKKFF